MNSQDVINADTHQLRTHLSVMLGWVSAEDVCRSLGWLDSAGEPDTRRLRRITQLTNDILSGENGYLLIQRATQEEFKRCVARQFSKIRSMAAAIRSKMDAWHMLHPMPTMADQVTQMELPGLADAYRLGGGVVGVGTVGVKVYPSMAALKDDLEKEMKDRLAAGLPVPDVRDQRELDNEDALADAAASSIEDDVHELEGDIQ